MAKLKPAWQATAPHIEPVFSLATAKSKPLKNIKATHSAAGKGKNVKPAAI